MTAICVIMGDGIGPEVVPEALETLDQLGLDLTYDVLDKVKADRFLATGSALSDDEVHRVRAADATLLGAIGHPSVTSSAYARGVLLRLRRDLDLYVNHRPVTLLSDRLSPLRDERRRGIDCVTVRENTEGLYIGAGGTLRADSVHETAIDLDVNTYLGVTRVLEYAFSVARTAVCVVDKSNAVPHGGALWQRCWMEQSEKHPHIEASHLYVDTAAMRLVADPTQFDVLVTNNSYGDILSDLAAQLGGGLGAAPSANVNPLTGAGLYEPVHGSAPDIAGTKQANPVGSILSAALMVERLGHPEEAKAIRRAVASAVNSRRCTPDLGGTLTTREAADAVRAALA